MPTSRIFKRIPLYLAAFWVCVTAWMIWNMQARDVAPAVFESDADVTVNASSDRMAFIPTTDTARVGVLFYPGALADPDAYAPMARSIATASYPVIILKLPYRLAPFAQHRAALAARTRTLIQETAHQRDWVLGGHSKGGKLAAQFAQTYASDLAGLLLVGTSHPREDDLSGLHIDVTKVYGSEDGLASEAEIHQFGVNLPEATHWTRIEGGNHAQFGWYGWQLGDGQASITRSEQQAATVQAVLDQLQRVSPRVPGDAPAG